MQHEVWKDINGFEGSYQISNFGNIKSLKHRGVIRDKILIPSLVRGYLYISLCLKNGGRKTYKVHRLVAESFIPNSENKPQVNHKDGNKLNNRLDNLEWATSRENNNHALKNGLRVHKKGKDCHLFGSGINSKLVLDTSTGIFYDSAKEASNCFGIKQSTMRAMLNGSYRNKTNLIYA